MVKMTKKSGLTLKDVKNMKFDPSSSTPPLDRNSKREKKSVGSSIDISKGERMENHEKSLFKKPAGKDEQILAEENLVSPRNHKECLDEREGLKATREKSDLLIRAGSSRGLDISKGERVMREKTTLNNPACKLKFVSLSQFCKIFQ